MSILKFMLAASLALGVAAMPAQAAVKKSSKPKATQAAPQSTDPDDAEPSITGSAVTDFDCELGNKITIYRNDGDEQHIALRWKKRLHRLTRIDTTTGAQRYENKLHGLVWIGIPAKGMLLDSKQGHQLANECKSAEQMKPAPTAAAPAPLIDSKG